MIDWSPGSPDAQWIANAASRLLSNKCGWTCRIIPRFVKLTEAWKDRATQLYVDVDLGEELEITREDFHSRLLVPAVGILSLNIKPGVDFGELECPAGTFSGRATIAGKSVRVVSALRGNPIFDKVTGEVIDYDLPTRICRFDVLVLTRDH